MALISAASRALLPSPPASGDPVHLYSGSGFVARLSSSWLSLCLRLLHGDCTLATSHDVVAVHIVGFCTQGACGIVLTLPDLVPLFATLDAEFVPANIALALRRYVP